MGVLLAFGCGHVADPADGDASGGARGWRDAGAVPATGGRQFTEEEAACNGVFHPLVPPRADAGACEFTMPSALQIVDRHTQVRLTENGLDIPLPFLVQPGDCKLNNDKGWYYDRSRNPKTIILCPATCASVATGTPGLSAVCTTLQNETP